ncbi:MAG: putative glycoside hydrolase [Gemmatimonadetes bacterium]|nr:putative glycoside hydrolase [Gemmatimonadota bacterium]
MTRGVFALGLTILIACGAAPGADDAADAAAEWPLSGIKLPTAEGPEVRAAPTIEEEPVSSEPDPQAPQERPSADLDASGPMIHTAREFSDFPDARFRRPEHVRGLYVNAWAAGSNNRMTELLELARRTEVNALVIDIKDATGFISHRTDVALAHEIGATGERRIRDLPALLDRLEAEGIYPIARIVVVKDPILSRFRPELAVQDTAGGVWIDSKDIIWLNPFSEGVWEYHVQIAREVAEMGFPEIQWDYIRFPDAPQSDMDRAVFTGAEGRERVDAIRGFLEYARDELSDLPVRSTADVFGVTTSFRRDVGIGQLWESFIDVVDVALPMVYPSHYWEGSFGVEVPNAYPYEIVRRALRDALRRSAAVEGAGLTRPWLQDFSLGQPIYGGPEVRAQIQATYDAGVNEWILWNPGSRYTESALEPIEGWGYEPLVRVAGLLTPVSRRHVVIDSVAALPPPVDSLGADTTSVRRR